MVRRIPKRDKFGRFVPANYVEPKHPKRPVRDKRGRYISKKKPPKQSPLARAKRLVNVALAAIDIPPPRTKDRRVEVAAEPTELGITRYLEIAYETGVSPAEVYSMFMSPGDYGIDVAIG